MTTRRRSSARCSLSVMASGDGRRRPWNGIRRRVAMAGSGAAISSCWGRRARPGTHRAPRRRARPDASTVAGSDTCPFVAATPFGSEPATVSAVVPGVDPLLGADPLAPPGRTAVRGRGRRTPRRRPTGCAEAPPSCRAFSCSSASRSRKARGERTAGPPRGWAGGRERRPAPRSRAGSATPQVVPRRADLARHLRELLGPQHDQRDNQDDQQFCRAERQHRGAESTTQGPRATAEPRPAGTQSTPLGPGGGRGQKSGRRDGPDPHHDPAHDDERGMGPKNRLSWESERLSPITKYSLGGSSGS